MIPREILIIKLGALGDVLRTTPLLRRLGGRVTWVTRREAFPLLAGNPRIERLVPVEDGDAIRARAYDLVINFDEDDLACRLASTVRARRRVGACLRDGAKTYCAASAPWFDMSLISRLGRESADRLKVRGRRSYQDFLFRACGLRFGGEEYMLPLRPARVDEHLVALERRVGPTWPAKFWTGFPELSTGLRAEGFVASTLCRRRRLEDYLEDINRCGMLVAGDTLAMHVALALRKNVVALFNCTSPHEIHGYGRMTKIVHKRLYEYFYRRDAVPGLSAAIPAERVLRAVRHLAASCARRGLGSIDVGDEAVHGGRRVPAEGRLSSSKIERSRTERSDHVQAVSDQHQRLALRR
ncbi:MAG: glycosyltransferase family 9 protein [Elusimicrobiota bacterium]